MGGRGGIIGKFLKQKTQTTHVKNKTNKVQAPALHPITRKILDLRGEGGGGGGVRSIPEFCCGAV